MWPEANRDELKSDDEEVEKPVNSFEKFCSEGELRNEVVAGGGYGNMGGLFVLLCKDGRCQSRLANTEYRKRLV